MLKKKDKGGRSCIALPSRTTRKLFKLRLSRRPQKRHELHELRELPFKIKDLQRERRKIKHELRELPFKIKDLRANRAFILPGGRGSNVVDEVGAVERGYNQVNEADAVEKRRATGRHSRRPTHLAPTKFFSGVPQFHLH